MSSEKDLEFWLDFVSKNEEQETNLEQITFYDLRRIFEYYFKNLDGELDRMIKSLNFPFDVKQVEVDMEKDKDNDSYRIKIAYHVKKDFIIDSYVIDKLGIYYTGYSFSDDQAEEFYKQNYDFFKRIVPVYYLNNMFYTKNFTFSKSYEDYKTGTKLNFSNNNCKPLFSVWRNVSKDMYDYEFTIFANNYLNNFEISELYDSVLKRIAVPISNIKYGFEDLIKLAMVDDILINKDSKVKKLD